MEKDIEEYRVEQFGEYDGCIYEKIFQNVLTNIFIRV